MSGKNIPSQRPQTFSGSCWSVQSPLGWNVRQDDVCVTLQRNESMGALQISSALKDVGAITQQDLAEFASDRVPDGVKQHPVAYGDFYGISAEYFKDESFWKEWWLKKGPLLVYVTYNVGQSHRHDEIEDVERILNSLKSLLT